MLHNLLRQRGGWEEYRLVDTREERSAELSTPRRVGTGPRLRRDQPQDFADEAEPRRATGAVRVTLPRTLAGTRLGRAIAALTFLFMLGFIAAGTYVARRYLLHQRLLFVPASASVEITGNRHLTRAQLLTVFGEDVDRNILTVPLSERRDQFQQLPWVQHATVMRLFPHTLRIAIVERTPVAFYRQGGRIGLIDGSGVLLPMQAEDPQPEGALTPPPYSFPVISGIGAAEPLSTRAARMRIFESFMTDMRATGDGIADRLSEVDLSNPEDVKALIPVSGSSDILVHFGDQRFAERYRHFIENLPRWKADYPKLASADMRYPRQVVLEMQPGTAVPVATTAENLSERPLQKHTPGKPRTPVHLPAPHLQTAYEVAPSLTKAKSHPREADSQ